MAGQTIDAQADWFGVKLAAFIPATVGSTWINAIGLVVESVQGESAPLVASRAVSDGSAGTSAQRLTAAGVGDVP